MLTLFKAAPLVLLVGLSECVKTEPVGGNPDAGTTTAEEMETATVDTSTDQTTGTETTASETTASETTASETTADEPFVPCDIREPETCFGQVDENTQCVFFPDTLAYPPDSCEATGVVRSCYQQPLGGDAGCAPQPTCAGAEALGVFFQERDDGTVFIMAGDYCGFDEPVGYQRCAWDQPDPDGPVGELVFGPPACDCVC